ncbi:MAG TPA: DNA methyltransferase [Rhizomicrobium sp.]|nr:DNA methyltransferase [Rhizomicrobium sp.]
MATHASLLDTQHDGSVMATLTGLGHGGKPARVDYRGGLPFFINEFWTAKQRQGHALHEVSYRACFKPQLPEFFISRLTAPGDCVYDPFMGRGTTALQAALMGRRAIANDINPLSAMLTRPRIASPTIEAVAKRLGEIDWVGAGDARDDLLVFYHRETLAEICALREYLMAREKAKTLDAVDDWIRMVALGRLTGHSPGFFSVYSLPPNQAVSVKSQARINERRSQIPPRRIVPDIILKKSRALLKDGAPPADATASFHIASAANTPNIATGSVDLVVTSPPFLDVVQYADDNWLRCWFAGIDAAAVPIAMHRKPEDWQAFIRDVFVELERVVKPGGHVAFEVGEVRGGKIALEELVLAAMAGLHFEPLGVILNTQSFTKTANCWGVSNNAKGTNTNRIVLARRIANR